MTVTFKPEHHQYQSADPEEKIDWISITAFVSAFKQTFDPVAQSIKSSKNPKSKWYNMTPEEIQGVWNKESERANGLGTWYHNQRESDLIGIDTIKREGLDLPIIKPLWNGEVKVAPAQNLTPGIYPEHFVYLKSAGLCGQSDRVEVIGKYVDIIDYKTNKEIKLQSYRNYEGFSQKMLGPLMHLDDCNFNHYALQLSLYMYIILKHNHNLVPRNMILQHITFEEEGFDKYDYPITKKDSSGDPIVKNITPYRVPYLKREVTDMIKYLHENKHKLKTNKA
jgi:hypothetical protein